MLIDGFQRVAALLFKALKFKDPEAFNEIHKILDAYESFLTQDYFGGGKPGMIDYMIWPWFERFENLKTLTNNELDKERFPKILKWVARMEKDKAVIETKANKEHMIEFYKTSLKNQEPDYDIGLPAPPAPPAAPEEEEEKEKEEKPAE